MHETKNLGEFRRHLLDVAQAGRAVRPLRALVPQRRHLVQVLQGHFGVATRLQQTAAHGGQVLGPVVPGLGALVLHPLGPRRGLAPGLAGQARLGRGGFRGPVLEPARAGVHVDVPVPHRHGHPPIRGVRLVRLQRAALHHVEGPVLLRAPLPDLGARDAFVAPALGADAVQMGANLLHGHPGDRRQLPRHAEAVAVLLEGLRHDVLRIGQVRRGQPQRPQTAVHVHPNHGIAAVLRGGLHCGDAPLAGGVYRVHFPGHLQQHAADGVVGHPGLDRVQARGGVHPGGRPEGGDVQAVHRKQVSSLVRRAIASYAADEHRDSNDALHLAAAEELAPRLRVPKRPVGQQGAHHHQAIPLVPYVLRVLPAGGRLVHVDALIGLRLARVLVVVAAGGCEAIRVPQFDKGPCGQGGAQGDLAAGGDRCTVASVHVLPDGPLAYLSQNHF